MQQKEVIEVKIVNRSHHPLPEYKTSGSVGMDLCANLDNPVLLMKGDTAVIPTGLYIQMPSGWEAQVRQRSGLSMKGIVAELGTIDSDYRGQIGIILHNQGHDAFRVEDGMRLAQLVFNRVTIALLEEVDSLDEDTERGTGGFGSTGV